MISTRRSIINVLRRTPSIRNRAALGFIPRRTLYASPIHFQSRHPDEREWEKLRKEYLKRETGFKIKPMPKEIVMPVPKDAFNVHSLERLEIIANFMLKEFIDRSDTFEKVPSFAKMLSTQNPDDIMKGIQAKFSKQEKNMSITKEEIESFIDLYYALSNHKVYHDQIVIKDPQVSKLWNTYLSHENGEQINVTELSEELEISTDSINEWFKIFEILYNVPFAGENEVKTFPLCPELKEWYINDKSGWYRSSNQDQTRKSKSSNKKKDDGRSNTWEFNFEFNPIFQMGLVVGVILVLTTYASLDHSREITFQEFVSNYLNKNIVSKIEVVNNSVAYVVLNDNGIQQLGKGPRVYFNIGSVETFERNLREAQDKYSIAPQLRVPVTYVNRTSWGKVIMSFLPTIFILGGIYWMTKKAASSMGGMGPMGFGKSTAKKFNQETDVKIKFKDVAGMSEAKEEVMEFVKFLQNPEKYEKLGAKIPRGAILSGPPGTGKTLIAKATAGEAGVPFYSVSGSEFVEMFVGVGASRVRDLFKTARENAPSIVFVDEIDAIGKQRSKGNATGANDERETTLNQLLVEMDGFDSTDHVVVLAGTNRSDILDKALMRPGRFDRHIHIDNPELQGRKEIFDVHLRKITLEKDVDRDLSGRLAALTPGFSGADIANVCNEAALIAARFNADAVELKHFELAIERVIGGIEKKSKILNPEEQKIVAYHEAGHAVCGWFLRHAHPLLKVSIIPRGQGALGYAQYLPPDVYLMSTLQLYDRMVMILGGRVSEELHFASVTGGAHDDFKKVTNIAQSMVLRFGMSEKVGLVNYADTRSQDDLTKPFSDATSRKIDQEIQRIVSECYKTCKELLIEKSKEVELVAQELLKKEFITREDMIRLLGKRPFPETNDAFDKYLDGKDAPFKDDLPRIKEKDEQEKESKDI
ncbi:unnamed protein product [Candida verbasci]|uniref:AAA+ ATPase domain-containing protein n=1 Tax=Candida verbasci TaxID=1227364 RepID=A0A9W4TSU5_9ASCO|nr:unnamed protein product [Candida verbasci]